MTRFRLFFLVAAAAFLTLVVACGGGSKTAGGSGSAKTQSLDLLNTAQKLLAVQSFHFSGDLKINVDSGSSGDVSPLLAMLGDINVQGAFVAPGDMDVTLKALGLEVHYVQIGTEAWLNSGDGWQTRQAIDISGIFDSAAILVPPCRTWSSMAPRPSRRPSTACTRPTTPSIRLR